MKVGDFGEWFSHVKSFLNNIRLCVCVCVCVFKCLLYLRQRKTMRRRKRRRRKRRKKTCLSYVVFEKRVRPPRLACGNLSLRLGGTQRQGWVLPSLPTPETTKASSGVCLDLGSQEGLVSPGYSFQTPMANGRCRRSWLSAGPRQKFLWIHSSERGF